MSKRKPELKLVEDTGSELLAEELLPEPPPVQGEMPFALVEGQPMTELPRDLYIPPDALQVFLEAFEGPLDLLLYLIRKQNLDILDIPIAEITRQYMKYIDVMADLQLELAGEYLLMAAMLAEIKSRMLLPRPPSADGTEEDDPRAELVRRLQEYERFKKAAEDIDKLSRQERDTMPASAELQERKVLTLQPDVTLKEMLLAFKDVLSRAEKFAHHHISRERLSQRERMSEILSRLQTQAFFEFTQLFRPEEGRMGVTVTFIAILELMKEGLIEIVQAEPYAPIHVRTAQRHLKVVAGNAAAVASVTADAENEAALAQPELDGENDVEDEPEPPAQADAQQEDGAVEGALAEAEALGVGDVVAGDAPPAAESLAAADDLSVTTPSAEDLSSEAAAPVVVADPDHAPASDVSVTEIADQESVVVAVDPSAVTGETSGALATDESQDQFGRETTEHAADGAHESGVAETAETIAADSQAEFDETSAALTADESPESGIAADSPDQLSSEAAASLADDAVQELGAAVTAEIVATDSQDQSIDETSEALDADELQESGVAETVEVSAADSQSQFAGQAQEIDVDESSESSASETVGAIAADSQSEFADQTSETLAADDSQSANVAEADEVVADSQEQFTDETSEALAADELRESVAAEAVDAIARDVQEQSAGEASDGLATEESQESSDAGTVQTVATDSEDQFSSETSEVMAAEDDQELGAAEAVEDVAHHDAPASETQALANAESDEHAVVSEQTSAVAELDEQPTSAADMQSFASTEPDEQVALASERNSETFAPPEAEEQPAVAVETLALTTTVEPVQQPAQDHEVNQDLEAPAIVESDEPVGFHAEQRTADQAIAPASEVAQHDVAEATVDQGAMAGVESTAEEVALQTETASLWRRSTATEDRFIPALHEQDRERSGHLDPAPEELANETSAAIEETSADVQASEILETETIVEQHVVEEHVVPEHVVKPNVVRQETSDIAGDLSASDDSVTDSSSEADNSDAEPSR